MKCHVNEKGGEPKEVTCQPPYDKYCNYIEKEGVVTRNCSAGEGLWPKVRCIKTSWFTSCLCKGDNCNAKCTWDNCKKIAASRSVNPNSDIAMYNCDANCKAEGNRDRLCRLLFLLINFHNVFSRNNVININHLLYRAKRR